jgi:hypothetical protein
MIDVLTLPIECKVSDSQIWGLKFIK